MRRVEIYSATDPVYVPDRHVWYWAEFEGERSGRITEWAPVNAYRARSLREA